MTNTLSLNRVRTLCLLGALMGVSGTLGACTDINDDVAVTARTKVATADASKGLSTGATDFAFSVDVSRQIGIAASLRQPSPFRRSVTPRSKIWLAVTFTLAGSLHQSVL